MPHAQLRDAAAYALASIPTQKIYGARRLRIRLATRRKRQSLAKASTAPREAVGIALTRFAHGYAEVAPHPGCATSDKHATPLVEDRRRLPPRSNVAIGLGGLGIWRLGQEDPAIWSIIERMKRPWASTHKAFNTITNVTSPRTPTASRPFPLLARQRRRDHLSATQHREVMDRHRARYTVQYFERNRSSPPTTPLQRRALAPGVQGSAPLLPRPTSSSRHATVTYPGEAHLRALPA